MSDYIDRQAARMKIGDRVFVRGYIDEIRKDTVIIRNAGGYFGTIPSEVITGALPPAQPDPNCSEIPNNSDTISRQAAIDAIGSYILSFTAIDRNYYEGLRDAKRLLNDIPSAEVEPVKHGRSEWIPCEERLPENREVVLITNDKGNVGYGMFRGVDYWRAKGISVWRWKNNTMEGVVAWMPLPEPYKEEEEHSMEEFMYGQDPGDPEDGSL